MIEATLRKLYEQNDGKLSDKWSIYLTEYDRLFSRYRDSQIRLLEIGIQNGGSLEIWSKYFPQAQHIVGCDINQDCAKLVYNDSRIAVVVGDANSDESERAITSISPQFDLIIDDGSHMSGDIIRSFVRYFPRLVDGGIFVAEDLHCSYWADFQGGLFDPASAIAFFKRLSDILSHEHWGVPIARKDILTSFARKYKFEIDEEVLAHIHSVEFINSLCVIRKNVPAANVLGVRFISGNDELIVGGHKLLHLMQDSTNDEHDNNWSARKQLPEDEYEANKVELAQLRMLTKQVVSLNQSISERDVQIGNLNQSVLERDVQIGSLNQSVLERDVQIGSLNQSVLERDVQIGSLNQSVLERDVQIVSLSQASVELRQSTSWKLTAPVRFLGRIILRKKLIINALPYAKVMCGGYSGLFKHVWYTYKKEGINGIKRRIAYSASPGAPPPVIDYVEAKSDDYADWVRQYCAITGTSREKIKSKIDKLVNKTLISILMPVYNPPLVMLKEAIKSVQNQLYSNWELCIADDASTDNSVRELLKECADKDHRIKVVFREKNGHISAASNSALELASGEYVALLDNDDLLHEEALFWIVKTIADHPAAGLIFSDEDKVDQTGRFYDPYFKPDWNPDLFLSHNMICHLGVYQTNLVRKLGGFRVGYEGAQDYDLALRCTEQLQPKQIVHIPKVLYHWRSHPGSTAQAGSEKNYALLAGQRALNDHFTRIGISAKAELLDFGMYRAHYDIPHPAPLVSLIIPTRNGLNLVKQCITSLIDKTTYSNYEILIVDNSSDDPKILDYFTKVVSDARIRVLRDERPFNYSALNNAAVLYARGEYLGLINNDIEVITPQWLDEMMSLATQPNVGAVGARLWYPNDTLQHGGVISGLGGVAGHSHKHLPKGHPGYFYRAQLVQTLSAVTAACLIIKKDIYLQMGGLDEANLKVAFNDVDFCLRVQEAGYRNVWTPYAELYHHESATRGFEDTPEKQTRFSEEVLYMQKRWGNKLLHDPAYNPNLTLDREDFSFAWPPRS